MQNNIAKLPPPLSLSLSLAARVSQSRWARRAFTEGRRPGRARDSQEIEWRILKTAPVAAAAVTHVSCVITYMAMARVASCYCALEERMQRFEPTVWEIFRASSDLTSKIQRPMTGLRRFETIQ